jgi:RHS repeat-associated protein
LLYSGERFDFDFGAYDLRARMYDQRIGRFSSFDSYSAGAAFEPLSLHKYLYTPSNPILFSDPSGHFFVSFVDVLLSASIQSMLAMMEGTTGRIMIKTTRLVVDGMGVEQAALHSLIAVTLQSVGHLGLGYAVSFGAALGMSLVSRSLIWTGQKLAIGWARVANGIVGPGTMLARSRLIPGGIAGKVIGGDSQALLRNMLKANGIRTTERAVGYQAHHLIPIELKDHRILKAIGMDLDDATNGILLSAKDVHLGYSSTYAQGIKQALDEIPETLSVQQKMSRVYEIQAKVADALGSGRAALKGNVTSASGWADILFSDPWF